MRRAAYLEFVVPTWDSSWRRGGAPHLLIGTIRSMHAPAQEAVVVVQGGQQHWALGTSDERRSFSVMHNWGKVLWSDPGAYEKAFGVSLPVTFHDVWRLQTAGL